MVPYHLTVVHYLTMADNLTRVYYLTMVDNLTIVHYLNKVHSLLFDYVALFEGVSIMQT